MVVFLAEFEQLPTAIQPSTACEVERSVQITAPHTRVYDILRDVVNAYRWDPEIREVTQVRRTKFILRTVARGTETVGLVGAIPYDRISLQFEGSLVQGVTFRVGLSGKLAQVDVTAKVSPISVATKVEEMLGHQLAALKRYAEYLTGGGNPSTYQKEKETLVGAGWIAM